MDENSNSNAMNAGQIRGSNLAQPLSGSVGESLDVARQGYVGGEVARQSFGRALERIKTGYRVTRIGWNARGQFVYLVTGSDPSNPSERSGYLNAVSSGLFEHGDTGTSRRMPHMALHNAQGASVPWTPSQTDCLAEDWITL